MLWWGGGSRLDHGSGGCAVLKVCLSDLVLRYPSQFKERIIIRPHYNASTVFFCSKHR